MLKNKRRRLQGSKAQVKSHKFAKKNHPRSKQPIPQSVTTSQKGLRDRGATLRPSPMLGISGAPSQLREGPWGTGAPTSHRVIPTSILWSPGSYLG